MSLKMEIPPCPLCRSMNVTEQMKRSKRQHCSWWRWVLQGHRANEGWRHGEGMCSGVSGGGFPSSSLGRGCKHQSWIGGARTRPDQCRRHSVMGNPTGLSPMTDNPCKVLPISRARDLGTAWGCAALPTYGKSLNACCRLGQTPGEISQPRTH